MTVVGADFGPIKSLKKAMVITLTNASEPSPALQETVHWKANFIPPMPSTTRLYIDFPLEEAAQHLALSRGLAHQYNATFSDHAFRSFGDSPKIKRKAIFLSWNGTPMRPTLIRDILSKFSESNLFPLIGWEDLYEVPEESYLITFDGTGFGLDRSFFGILTTSHRRWPATTGIRWCPVEGTAQVTTTSAAHA